MASQPGCAEVTLWGVLVARVSAEGQQACKPWADMSMWAVWAHAYVCAGHAKKKESRKRRRLDVAGQRGASRCPPGGDRGGADSHASGLLLISPAAKQRTDSTSHRRAENRAPGRGAGGAPVAEPLVPNVEQLRLRSPEGSTYQTCSVTVALVYQLHCGIVYMPWSPSV